MVKPLPLTVYGPITPISPFVRVTGVLPTATVAVLADGTPIGDAVASNPGELLMPLGTQPTVGQQITAVQETADGASEASPQPLLVTAIPDPLPVPVIASALHSCMVDIWAGALVPGATVITTIGGQPFGSTVAAQTAAWLGLDPTRGIPAGTRAEVRQEATIGAQTLVSTVAQSLPIPAFTLATDRLPPPVLGPLIACDTARSFLSVVAGAATTIENEGQSEGWINPANSYQGNGAPPLRPGKAVAVQQLPRCRRPSEPVVLPVADATVPSAPLVTQALCPQALRLTVAGLVPGGILHVVRRVEGAAPTELPLGDLGIGATTQQVDLPPTLALTDPDGPVVILLSQSRCAGNSPTTRVQVAALAGPFGTPRITEPLFDCMRAIPLTGAHPGALVQALDARTGLPLSDPYSADRADFPLSTWFPLATDQVVSVRQWGCNANGDTPAARVQTLPLPLPAPTIVEPVRPHAPWIKVTGVVPGARLHLMVNNVLRPGGVDSLADTAIIAVTGVPLAERDRVFVVQTLCAHTSAIEGRGVAVTRGTLKVTVVPASLVRGSAATVVVTALDADTGAAVSAQLLLNGKVVGTTGIPFAYAPQPGEPNPVGIVREPVAYSDAPFSITLVDPQVTLALHAGPVPAFLDALRIEIDEISWTVTPDWNTALGKTLPVKPTPPSATTSGTFPAPTGAVKTMTVTIAGKASTAGGYFNGFSIAAQSFPIGTDTRKVAFVSNYETIGWLLTVQYATDQAGNLYFGLIPTFAGITP